MELCFLFVVRFFFFFNVSLYFLELYLWEFLRPRLKVGSSGGYMHLHPPDTLVHPHSALDHTVFSFS